MTTQTCLVLKPTSFWISNPAFDWLGYREAEIPDNRCSYDLCWPIDCRLHNTDHLWTRLVQVKRGTTTNAYVSVVISLLIGCDFKLVRDFIRGGRRSGCQNPYDDDSVCCALWVILSDQMIDLNHHPGPPDGHGHTRCDVTVFVLMMGFVSLRHDWPTLKSVSCTFSSGRGMDWGPGVPNKVASECI